MGQNAARRINGGYAARVTSVLHRIFHRTEENVRTQQGALARGEFAEGVGRGDLINSASRRWVCPGKDLPTSGRLLCQAVILQDLLGEEVLHLGLIANHVVVGRLQQLLATITKLIANRLLDARIVQFALTGRFLGH